MINLTIDNKPFAVEKGTTVLKACQLAGVNIPTLCYLEKIQEIGACRVCLVEIDGIKDLVASCVMPVSEDMKVHTNNRRVREARDGHGRHVYGFGGTGKRLLAAFARAGQLLGKEEEGHPL